MPNIIPAPVAFAALSFILRFGIFRTPLSRSKRVIKSLFCIAKNRVLGTRGLYLGGQEAQAQEAGAILKALVSKMAPRWLKMSPKSPRRLQDRPKMAPRRPKIILRWAKMAPRCTKIGLGWPNMDFMAPQKLSWKDLVSQRPEKKWFDVRFAFDLLSTQACSTYSRRAVSLWRPSSTQLV